MGDDFEAKFDVVHPNGVESGSLGCSVLAGNHD
jgi:hypothetical protein